MIKFYHNPRCSKSRQGLEILKNASLDFETIEYLKNPLSKKEIKEIIDYLNIDAIDLIRTSESDWKEHFKGKNLREDEIISAMVEFPKLIERPIVISNQKGVIGRPPENIALFLKNI
ncbi:arsenate reductase (glutaredoxin) [Namhaeicola litoreus]|uniref:Arsenate reductase (Glutaredoxin) n=1 Tax=Namhaeicola litoreus TaxID=1052145 RepID=A0ABW3Y550_9FLAO